MERNRTELIQTMPDQEKITADDRNLAVLAHIGTLFGWLIVPLVVWLVKKDESNFIAEHAKQSINFQLSMMIYITVSIMLVFLVVGIFTLIGLAFFSIWVTIVATVEAGKGKPYKYPLTIQFIQ